MLFPSHDRSGYCHFPLQFASGGLCDEEYFDQLTAERCVTKYKRGFPVQVWEKTRARNEVTDIHVYSYAALKLLNPAWDALQKRVQRDDAEDKEKNSFNKKTD